MNNIFLKNLTALSQKNPELATKIQTYIPQELPKLVNDNGVYNLLYKNTLIHNPTNPLAEAQEVFAMSKNSPVSIHIIYGLGLGYLFQFASLKSEGAVILYEPNLDILWTAFTLVDFSGDILKDNVTIAADFDTVSEAIYKKSGMKNFPEMLSIPSQRNYNPEEFEALVKKLLDLIGSYSLDLKYTKQKFYPSLKMLLKNIPFLLEETPLAYFKDIYKGKTAVIVSAGPTLDKNIETLKKYRDKFILFTVGTAVKTLYQHNIKPDFLCIIETFNSSKQIENLDLSDVNFITEPYSNPAFRKFNYKKRFSHISANSPVNHFWSEICGENIEEYWSKGTVSYTAINSARLLGCSKIILVGQDLAYIQGQCYSKDSAYKDLSCQFNKETNRWEIVAEDFEKFAMAISASENPEKRAKTARERLQNLNNSLYYVKGINGDMIPTESVYASFVEPLSEYTKYFNDREYINTSLVGAQIDGYKNISLEEALQNTENVGGIELKNDFSYNRAKIIENLNQKLQELKTAKPFIEEGLQHLKNLNNDLSRHKTVSAETLKTLKKLSINYLTLSSDFANKSKMFDFIITADKIDLDYEMKIIKEFSLENVTHLSEKMLEFYENAKNRSRYVEVLINESLNTAS